MSNRHISNNIRLVLDLIDYPHLYSCHLRHLILLNIILFFLHLKNLVSVTISLKQLKLYTLIIVQSNCILAPHPDLILIVVSDRDLPYFSLFLLCSQLLADFMKHSTLRGITVAGNIITISQLADDTTLYFKDV